MRARGVTRNVYFFRAVFFYPFDGFPEIVFGFITKANNYVGEEGEIFKTGTEFCNNRCPMNPFYAGDSFFSVQGKRLTGSEGGGV